MTMMKKTVLGFTSVFILLAVGLGFLVVYKMYQTQVCYSPVEIFGYSQQNRPENLTANLLATLGGLPKTNMDVYEAQKQLEAHIPLPVYAVKAWHIANTKISYNPDVSSFGDDDPTYSREFDIYVTYADGDTAVLHSSSWSYGVVVCPMVISLGLGPPVRLNVIP